MNNRTELRNELERLNNSLAAEGWVKPRVVDDGFCNVTRLLKEVESVATQAADFRFHDIESDANDICRWYQ